MKNKIFKTVIALSVFNVSIGLSEIMKWSDDGKKAYNSLNSNSWYRSGKFQTDANGNIIPFNTKIELVALKNTSSVVNAFKDSSGEFLTGFAVRRVKGVGRDGSTVKGSTVGKESCQCVAFVKSMTGVHKQTGLWIQGGSVNNTNIPIGIVIATFGSDGKYDGRHTAIVVGKDGYGKWIEVIDQNWESMIDEEFATREEKIGVYSPTCYKNPNGNKKGFVTKHRLYFDGHTGQNSARSYNIVEY